MTPAARIVLDGIDITANLIPAPFGLPLEGGGMIIPTGFGSLTNRAPLMSVSVDDNEGLESDSVDLEIDNRLQIPAPKKGAKLKIWLGYATTGLVYMGTFEVDTWSKRGLPRTLTVSAKAAGFTTEIKAPRSRSYHRKTVGELVEQVAERNGLDAVVHPALRDLPIGHIDQSGESDVNFLTRLAKRIGGNFKIGDSRLIMNKAGAGTLPSGSPAPVFSFTQTGQESWEATGADRGSYKSASASWQDTKKGERQSVVVGEGKPRYRDRKLYKTEEEARQAAKATIDGLTRGKVSFSTSFPGRPEVFAGARALVSNHDPDVDGIYVIKSARHSLDGSGLKTS
ncbi:contractile injection system protein, VgrG/Pvc8 family, partial [Aureimonas psammosilenae]|uniref:contractile injection system protein, VgrG/Pvc8 family n=1 Tax=Aureimonas psammosilenae TaxID=2495496 RepID=UPI001260F889